MQGLLKQPRAAQQPPEEQEMPEEQMQDQAMPGNAQLPEGMEEADESDPAYQAATEFVMRALYEQGAADEINKTMKASQSPADDIATIVYELSAVADEKTGGDVPDEMLMPLAFTVMAEVVEIAEASGVQIRPRDIASAMKMMISRFGAEMGYDMSELEAAMNQVSADQIDQLAMQETQEPAAQQPQQQGA